MAESVTPLNNTDRLYTIGELAREYDVTTRTLRFYETAGLLEPKRERQKRLYTRRDRTRLKLTLRGKRLGMTLAEIKEVFDLYDSAQGEVGQIRRYLDILKVRREHLLRQRKDVEDAIAELDESERRCRAVLTSRRERNSA